MTSIQVPDAKTLATWGDARVERWLQSYMEAQSVLYRTRQRYPFALGKRNDYASAVVASSVLSAAGAGITGTTKAAVLTSPVYAGSGGNTTGTVGAGFWYPGKAIRLTSYGSLNTTAAGTATWDMNLNTTGGASLGASAAITLVTGQTNSSWHLNYIATCRSVGSSGTIIGMGSLESNPAVIASTAQTVMMPATGPTTATIDTTAAAGNSLLWCVTFSLTGNTITPHLAFWEALN